jgi:hypothetical protein
MPYSWRQNPPGDATRDCALFHASANSMDTSGCVGGLHERVSAMLSKQQSAPTSMAAAGSSSLSCRMSRTSGSSTRRISQRSWRNHLCLDVVAFRDFRFSASPVLQPLLGETSAGTVGLVALALNFVIPMAIIFLEMNAGTTGNVYTSSSRLRCWTHPRRSLVPSIESCSARDTWPGERTNPRSLCSLSSAPRGWTIRARGAGMYQLSDGNYCPIICGKI